MGLRDPVSSASHLLAVAWAAWATRELLRRCPPDPGRRAAVLAFGGSMVLLFLASGVYHAVPFSALHHPAALKALQTLDRSAIFVLIAGTNTPVMSALLAGRWRRWGLRAVWALAVAGVATLWLFPKPPFALTVGLYAALGWLGAVPLARYARAVGWRALRPSLAGAVLYTAGAACDLLQWPHLTRDPVRVGPHELFHLAIVAAAASFCAFVARHAAPHPLAPAGADRPTAVRRPTGRVAAGSRRRDRKRRGRRG